MFEILDKVKHSPDLYCLLDESISSSNKVKTQAISFVNPFSYLILRNEQELLSNLDYLYTDAISSAKIFSFLFRKKIPRVSFDLGSFARHFLEKAQEHKLPLYLLGAKGPELEKAVNTFKKQYPDLNIVGSRDGYFSDDEAVMQQILDSGAQYVICGMGTPRQDEFACKLKLFNNGQIKQIYTCGGFLHQSSEKFEYYPEFINKYHLRWFYRAINDSYVLKRLLKDYPMFLFVVFYDFLFKTTKNNQLK